MHFNFHQVQAQSIHYLNIILTLRITLLRNGLVKDNEPELPKQAEDLFAFADEILKDCNIINNNKETSEGVHQQQGNFIQRSK